MKFKVNDFFGLFRTKQWWAVSHQNSAHEIEVTGAPRLRGGYLNFMSTCLHERKIVHHDIKLDNILIDRDPKTGKLVVRPFDFDNASIYRKKEISDSQAIKDIRLLGIVFYKMHIDMNASDRDILTRKNFPEPKKDTFEHLIWEMLDTTSLIENRMTMGKFLQKFNNLHLPIE